ncbi:MAG: Sporulation and cell division repeat protein [uncultured bacterium]|nr:MAG: Sporulation and cell division repeat protein [uncultured bacterium]
MRDYAKKSSPELNGGSQHNKLWILFVIIFIFLAFFVYVSKNFILSKKLIASNAQLPKPDAMIKKQIAQTKSLVLQKSTSDKMQYDFYQLLPEMTVNVSSSEATNASKTAVTTANTASFVLQIAALQNPSDAKVLQNQLADAGYHAFVQSYLANQKTWYRVMVGPFHALSQAQDQQLKLDNHNIEALLIKVK